MKLIRQKIFGLLHHIKIEPFEDTTIFKEICSYCALKQLIDLNAFFGFNIINPCQHHGGQVESQHFSLFYRYFMLAVCWINVGISIISPFMDEEPEFRHVNMMIFSSKPSIMTIFTIIGVNILIAVEVTYISIIRITLPKELDKVIGRLRRILPYIIPFSLLCFIIFAIVYAVSNILYRPSNFMWKYELIMVLITTCYTHSLSFLLVFAELIIILIICIIVAFRKITDDFSHNKMDKNIPDLLREIDFRHADLTRFVYQLNDCGKDAIGFAYFIALGEIALLIYLCFYETFDFADAFFLIGGTIIFSTAFTVLALLGGEIENAAKTPFSETSLYIRFPLGVLEKMKLLCLMKRLGGSSITVTCMGFFAINKLFICRAYKALFSTFTTILEIQKSEKKCVNVTMDIWKEFL